MDKSIETIWKEGFIDSHVLVAPKINDLYNRKSKNLIDKFDYMFSINRKAIMLGIGVILVLSIGFGLPYLGCFVSALLIGLLLIGNKGLKELNQLDKTTNSYKYLKDFSSWRTEMVETYCQAYTYFYPLLFMGLAIRFRFSEDAQSIINSILAESPETIQLLGLPWYFVMIFVVISAAFYYFGSHLYKIDLDLVYGPSFRKLDELVEEMEELRK